MAHGEVSMVAELVGAIGTLSLLFGYLNMRIVTLHKDQKELRQSTYTKEETRDTMNDKISPIKETTERLIDSNEKLVSAISDLRVSLARHSKDEE